MENVGNMENLEYNKTDIKDIAKFQKLICWLFLIMIIGLIYPMVTLVAQVVSIFAVYYLARSLKLKRLWIYPFGCFFPFVALVVLWSVITKATKVLKNYNIKVGIMGANKDDLKKFLSLT